MRLRDIAGQGVKNLLRHGGRTILTVLGVVVGCCSVVIMLSIGIGMRLSTEATLAQMGDLQIITVEQPDTRNGQKLDDSVVEMISHIDHAESVIPKLRFEENVSVYSGTGDRYIADFVPIVGEDVKLAKEEGYRLFDGDWHDIKKNDVLAGQMLAYSFFDTRKPEGHNMIDIYNYYDWETNTYSDLPKPYVDLYNDPLTLVISNGMEGADYKALTYDLHIGAILQEDWNRGYETSSGLIMDVKSVKTIMDDFARLIGTKSQSEKGYSEILVKADNISSVESVEQEIRSLGLRTTSMESIRKPMEQDVRQKQMLLGAVGAVSLFVAALGIANTMIMAITERTREIGVMKALGCFLNDIRKMFLLEAGCIGLIGGTIGVGFSYLGSWIMNNMADLGSLFSNEYDYMGTGETMDISVIPWWLAICAVGFSILIGVLAGLYPAEKAVRISALDAIRRE